MHCELGHNVSRIAVLGLVDQIINYANFQILNLFIYNLNQGGGGGGVVRISENLDFRSSIF